MQNLEFGWKQGDIPPLETISMTITNAMLLGISDSGTNKETSLPISLQLKLLITIRTLEKVVL
jgi:hypothetical protein